MTFSLYGELKVLFFQEIRIHIVRYRNKRFFNEACGETQRNKLKIVPALSLVPDADHHRKVVGQQQLPVGLSLM